MAKKKMTKEEFSTELSNLSEHLKSNYDLGGFQRFWESSGDYQRWSMSEKFWDIAKEFPPLIAAAHEHGRPSEGGGKWIFKIVAPELMEEVFGRQLDRFVEQLKELMTVDWSTRYTHVDRQFDEIEARSLAYSRYKEFVAALKAAGVTQYKTDLTDHGMTAKEVKDLEKYIADKAKEIDKIRNPAPKEPLFDAPKKGSKYPLFGDIEYTQYIKDLQSKYMGVLEGMTGFSGMSLGETQVEDMMNKLADFDYAEICATLGAQKRWPPKDDYDSNAKFYEFIATLPQAFAKRFEEKTAKDIQEFIKSCVESLKSSEGGSRGWAFKNLRNLKNLLRWLQQKIPGIDSQAFTDAQAAVAREFDPRWAAMSAGPLHEKYMGQIKFSNSNALPLNDEWPETLNPVKDYVYAHVFLDKAMKDLASGNMLFIEAGSERYQFNVQLLPGDSAYLCMSVLPENGRNPDLIRTLGKALLAAEGEVQFVFTPIVERSAVGTLKMKMTKADAAKLPARIEELAVRADANKTAAAVLPENFATAQKWPYKDKVLTAEKVKEALETAWEYNYKKKINILHMRVNHYRPGNEWDVEFNPRQEPVARLAFSYIGLIFEQDGKIFAVPDGIQLRQFWNGPGQGFGEDLNVLFWGVNPFALPPEQVKRIAK